MNAAEFVNDVLLPGASWCSSIPEWRAPFSYQAMLWLTTISGQEANWTARVQTNNGPAHGLFQFERRGGVAGILTDDATKRVATAACLTAGVSPNSLSVWQALAVNDNLAVAFARLLLWSDEAPLPLADDESGGYQYYLRNWRPGAPSARRWHACYSTALLTPLGSGISTGPAISSGTPTASTNSESGGYVATKAK